MKEDTQPNPHQEFINESEFVKSLKGAWPEKNTALLVMHGIGSQKPLETIDIFARGIVSSLVIYGGHANQVVLTHKLVAKQAGDESYFWFDNFIRITHKEHAAYIDVYEYYWAHYTEDKTSMTKIFTWLRKVTKGARHFYKNNKILSTGVKDKSIFVNEKKGFNFLSYFLIIYLCGSAAVIVSLIVKGLLALLRFLPGGNYMADFLLKKVEDSGTDTANILGDIAIYNEVNPRSPLCNVRKEILNGAVKAIRYLVEPHDDKLQQLRYERVAVAGHSLGSQISFDAINRLTHQVNLGELKGYNSDGYRVDHAGNQVLNQGSAVHINSLLDRFFTFGSPLDKIAFFLREQCEDDEYIRIQMLENFHCFKQRSWINIDHHPPIKTPVNRIFDDIVWRNYYHNRDYVSGSLDYYHKLTNIRCNFTESIFKFTHSYYWYSKEFFGDLLIHLK